ncbi:MAG: adenine deaminase [Phycisphaerae bacterium]|nr:adenine deaminase [Phycisphaerae bacterium]
MCGNVVDVIGGEVFPATLHLRDGRIADMQRGGGPFDTFLLPGFVDSHIHIESSMLPPREFSRLALPHGTVACVSDPHEIANVLGVAGVQFMLAEAAQTPMTISLGAPACVPVTPFETAGGRLGPRAVANLLDDPRIGYLSEVCNYPAVIAGDRDTLAKIFAAQARGKPVDGHAPGLRGPDAASYAQAGVSTDHECMDADEAYGKIALGMHVQIREGSAARNFAALDMLIDAYPERCMFCSDDRHPDDLLRGHINALVRRAVADGLDLMNVLQAACVNPVRHYNLPVGLLRLGDPADCIEVDSLETFAVLRTILRGRVVAQKGQCLLPFAPPAERPNAFAACLKAPADFAVPARGGRIHVIEAIDGQLATNRRIEAAPALGGMLLSDPSRDLLKIAVVNRYADAPPAMAFIRGFGLRDGAIASSVAHDSHNVIAVGVGDRALARAVNLIIEHRGGLALATDSRETILPLPIAGLMSDQPGNVVAEKYANLSRAAKDLGSSLSAPYMTLSFMALLVIPQLKLSDRGLFDTNTFSLIDLFV